MLRILKYFKPFTPLIVPAIILLFIQANADLALPDYMSQIVNIGIQQGGIEHAVPEAIRYSQMQRVLLFLEPGQRTELLDLYRLIDKDAPDYATYLDRIPGLSEEPVYVLEHADDAVLERLDPVVAKAILIVAGIEQMTAHPEAPSARMPMQMEQLGLDLSKLPPGTDLFAVLANLPDAQRANLLKAFDAQIEALGGDTMVIAGAARAIKAEYETLGIDTGSIQTRYIVRTGGWMLLIAAVSAVSTIVVGYLAARTAAGLAKDLRHRLFKKVMFFSNAELDRFSTASLITRTTNDVTQIQSVTMMMRMAFYAPIIGIGGVLHAMDKNSSMWWLIAVAVFALLILIGTVFRIATPRFKIVQQFVDRLNRIARENLTGMMVIRAFNRESYETQRFDNANRELTDTQLFIGRVFVVVTPVMMLIMNGLILLIIWVGSHRVAEASMRVGDMMAFMQYAMQIVSSFLMLSMMFIFLPRADVSANRIADVLETEPSVREPEDPVPFPEPFDPTVEFRHVHFRYPDAEEDVLHDIDFIARAGETIGIIGTTGSGKSTVVNLIPRFYDVTAGSILIDGVDIRDVSLKDLRANIGYIPQHADLFSGTIESNLRFADETADEERLRLALKIAQAED
ncbi:MAG TPA: ABC transporter ATP-binding protein, partial [Chloroflexi bacterium]|nr:ABC transporter ATP-binding protein [Chloroflexota bacterium]